ncbi:MAG: IMPACT family protein [Synergistales bacterium]|nr:IMPACT family protein [Synergistales bacterium]
MNEADLFRVIAEEIECEETIKRSRFIGHARRATTGGEARQIVKDIAQQHGGANHNCWAYRVGFPSVEEYYSDDGEPSGSAGKPILGAIRRRELTMTVVVVTRYFGGIKLGVRGLIEAYGGTARKVLEASGSTRQCLARPLSVRTSYAFHEPLLAALKELQVPRQSVSASFAEGVTLTVMVPLSSEEAVTDLLEGFARRGDVSGFHWLDREA